MTRLEQLPLWAVYVLAKRAWFRLERVMTHPSNGWQPYGWDMNTANVLHPRLVRVYRAYREEFTVRARAAGFKDAVEFQRAAVPKRVWTTGRRRRRRTLASVWAL